MDIDNFAAVREGLKPAYKLSDELIEKLSLDNKIEPITREALLFMQTPYVMTFGRFDRKSAIKMLQRVPLVPANVLAATRAVTDEQGNLMLYTLTYAEDDGAAMYAAMHELGWALLNPNLEDFMTSARKAHICHDEMLLSDETMQEMEAIQHDSMLEQQANVFALRMLMPRKTFYTALRIWDSYDEIAKKFGVSQGAVIARLTLPEPIEHVER